jgi:hypothetical protein
MFTKNSHQENLDQCTTIRKNNKNKHRRKTMNSDSVTKDAELMTCVLKTPTVYVLYSKNNPLVEVHLNNESKTVNIIDKQFVQDMTAALDVIDDLLKKGMFCLYIIHQLDR